MSIDQSSEVSIDGTSRFEFQVVGIVQATHLFHPLAMNAAIAEAAKEEEQAQDRESKGIMGARSLRPDSPCPLLKPLGRASNGDKPRIKRMFLFSGTHFVNFLHFMIEMYAFLLDVHREVDGFCRAIGDE